MNVKNVVISFDRLLFIIWQIEKEINLLIIRAVHFNLQESLKTDRCSASRPFIITQYGSTVYIGMAMVWPAL